ncbi:MAG: hypothetical protein IJ429_00480 [Lachnospiraceae bacterium]|nr:hypothetical protein [Lachnospiraceae bacterium]
MKNVCFLEWVRQKRKFLNAMLASVGVLLCLFAVCTICDKVLPEFNRNYMNWPDYMKQLLGLSGWSGFLWYNIWQILAVFYPFLHIYMVMNAVSESISDEERLETIIFLRNAGVSRMTVLGVKILFWAGYSLVVCLVQAVIIVLLANLSGIGVVSVLVFRYYSVLFLVSFFCIGMACNPAVSGKKLQRCKDIHLSLLVLPWLIAKIPDVIRMFAKLLEITGRSESVVIRFEVWEQKTSFLHYVSPVSWCIPGGQETPAGVMTGYVLIAVILFLTAFKIYHDK